MGGHRGTGADRPRSRPWRPVLGLGAGGLALLAAGLLGGLNPSPGRRDSPVRADTRPVPEVDCLVGRLRHCTGRTDVATVARYLEELGRIGSGAADAAPTLVALASDRSSVFQDRDKYEVTRLRAFMLATLARVGMPGQAVPLLADQLANDDNPHTIAAAARAVGALGPRARWAVPLLARAVDVAAVDEPLSLVRYDQSGLRPEETTTMRLEAVRALARIGPGAKEAIPALRRLLDDPGADSPTQSLLRKEVGRALAAIEPRTTAPTQSGKENVRP